MTWGILGRLNTSVLDKFSGDPSFRAGEPPVLSPSFSDKTVIKKCLQTMLKKHVIELLIKPHTNMESFFCFLE